MIGMENMDYKKFYENSQVELDQIKQQLALLKQINKRLYANLTEHASLAQKLHVDLEHTAHTFQVTGDTSQQTQLCICGRR